MTLSSQNKNTKQIILNAFDMNSVGHINHGLWTHPRDESLVLMSSAIGPIWRKL